MTCAFCSNEFAPKRWRRDRKFCSKSCAMKSHAPPKGFRNSGSFGNGRPAWNKGLLGFRAGEKRPQTADAIRRGHLTNGRPRKTPANEAARKTVQYKAWRAAVFERDDYTCQECGARSKAGERVQLHADHIVPFAVAPELRLEITNGKTLCVPCHKNTPTYGAGAMKFTGKKAVRADPPPEAANG